MRHTLKLQGIIVGHSDLEEVDAADRRVWGHFRPGIGYELVQPIFRLLSVQSGVDEVDEHDCVGYDDTDQHKHTDDRRHTEWNPRNHLQRNGTRRRERYRYEQ